MRKFMSENRSEIIILALALFGAFLLYVSDLGNRLKSAISGLLRNLPSSSSAAGSNLADFFDRFSTLELIGTVLIFLAIVFGFWRVRIHFLKSPGWRSKVCPRCGSPLQRVHRTRLDHLAERLFLPHSRRYRCSNSSCHWTGLRHHERRLHRSQAEDAGQPAN